MKRIMNQKGSTLLVSLITVMVLSIVLILVFSINYSMYHRTIDNVKESQAYYTALSGIEMLTNEIVTNGATSDKTGYKLIENAKTAGSSGLNINNLGFPIDMGICSAKLLYSNKKLYISATATVDNQTYTMNTIIEEITPEPPPIDEIIEMDTVFNSLVSAKLSGGGNAVFTDQFVKVANQTATNPENRVAVTVSQNNYKFNNTTHPMYIFIDDKVTLSFAGTNNIQESFTNNQNGYPIYFILGKDSYLDFGTKNFFSNVDVYVLLNPNDTNRTGRVDSTNQRIIYFYDDDPRDDYLDFFMPNDHIGSWPPSGYKGLWPMDDAYAYTDRWPSDDFKGLWPTTVTISFPLPKGPVPFQYLQKDIENRNTIIREWRYMGNDVPKKPRPNSNKGMYDPINDLIKRYNIIVGEIIVGGTPGDPGSSTFIQSIIERGDFE